MDEAEAPKRKPGKPRDPGPRPSCCGRPMRKRGVRNGVQRWRCPVCKTWGSDGDRLPGRQAQGDQPMTGAERVRKHRAKKKEE